MKTHAITRRQFMKTSLTLVAACAASPAALAAARKIPIGLQLYAVRDEFTRDVPGTLKTVSSLGFQAVEFWGYGGTPKVFQDYDAQQLRKMLDDLGLKCCGMHLQLKALEPAQFEQTVTANQILGNRFLIVAAAQEKMGSEEAIKGLVAFLNGAAEKCRTRNLRVGYHAHPFDFVKIQERFAWDFLFSQLNPEVIMQMDVANCLGGHGDPVAMLKKFPGRALSVHLRQTQDQTFDGSLYQDVFQLCEPCAEWFVVEEGGEGGGFDAPRKALEALRRRESLKK
jgi:sugar phosphate isomerase/epimerase